MILVAEIIIFSRKIVRRLLMIILGNLFASKGKNFIFNPYDKFSYQNISVGSDVFIGQGANFSSSESEILIGSKVMFGPNVTIITGDHNTSVIGEYMFDVKKKLSENDLPVIIEDDVWVGTGAIILKGVRIGSGSIIAAGALILKDVPKNSIVGGVPAKILRNRFNENQLREHKELLKSRVR
ncbi:hypothetical protein GCM10007103_29150 [Salinimicrobium marinum]|uniref:Acyltransferase n=1 Tax=Salinimicrobium marinum TaxID=680283 RepID=A0A918SJH1_9FLAO|nr:DapH/DapD/GlmU-related protein [Salinimicrobium marinum]GHA46213.1 hypothetical protein GCM10007103_29150 [Salinimicrobium marinum]